MEVDEQKAMPSSLTFDEVSMERSKSFVKALQRIILAVVDWKKKSVKSFLGRKGSTCLLAPVLLNSRSLHHWELKNLRPQLYSAAEYCEKSYLHSEQKQMVLDNLKDYTVRALVNAVDHLGTVAFKLTDLVEQQTADVSTMDVKVACLNQKLLTCQTYMDKEGLRQQQLLAVIPRHHKRYILPNSVNKKVHFSPSAQADPRQMHVQAKPRVHPADSPGSKTLSWHLTSGTKAPIMAPQKAVFSSDFQKVSPRSATVFHLLDNEDSISRKSSVPHSQVSSGNPTSTSAHSYGVTHRDTVLDSKLMAPLRSSANSNSQQAIVKAPLRSKSMLSAFFVKQKSPKLRSGTVS